MNEATYFQQQYMDEALPEALTEDDWRLLDSLARHAKGAAYTSVPDADNRGKKLVDAGLAVEVDRAVSYVGYAITETGYRAVELRKQQRYVGEEKNVPAESSEYNYPEYLAKFAPNRAELSENPPEAAEQPHGAICELCGQDMLAVDDCNANRQIDYTDGTRLRPIPYGSEGRALYGRDDAGNPLPSKRCHDCNVTVGSFHHIGCDVEECPRCHRQLITCDCDVSDRSLAEAHEVSTQVEQDAKLRQDKAIAAALAEERRYEIALQIIEKYQAHISKVDGVVHRICSILDIRTHIDAETPFDTAELLGTEILPAIREIGAERDSLLARVKTLEDVVRPFACAALDKAVQTASDRNLYVRGNRPMLIALDEAKREFLNTNHLDAALEAMPDVRGANADCDPA